MTLLCTVGVRIDGSATIAIEGADTVLRSVRVVPAIPGGATTVLLEADGPLPEPLSGAVEGPPRVYLDLQGGKTEAGRCCGGTGSARAPNAGSRS